jgi:hypothetical protein
VCDPDVAVGAALAAAGVAAGVLAPATPADATPINRAPPMTTGAMIVFFSTADSSCGGQDYHP